MHISRIITLSTFLLLVTGGIAAASDRPQLYGYAPAYPLSRPLFEGSSRSLGQEGDLILHLEITVEKDGSAKKLASDADSLLMNYVKPYLLGLKYAPTLENGKPIKAALPVDIRMQAGVGVPDFFFPVDTDQTVADRDLFVRAVKSLGVKPPKVLNFPSFSCPLKSTDSMLVYPFVLVNIQLDKAGKLVSADIDTSTYSTYSQQILSAVRFATFEPARIKNKKVASDALLLISFFPQVSYPNKRWTADSSWQATLLERNQVRLIPVKYGLLSKPLPRRVPADSYPIAVAPDLYGKIAAWVTVDSLGETRGWSLTRIGLKERKQAIKLVRNMRFFPAIAFDGRPVSWDGLMYFTVENNTNIRIDYSWLTGSLF